MSFDDLVAQSGPEMQALVADQRARRTAGGPWRVYIALPGRKTPTYLKGSYATEAEAQKCAAVYDPKYGWKDRVAVRYEPTR